MFQELLGVLVVWIQKESLCEVSYRARVLPTTVAHHSPPHPSFLEGGLQRNSPKQAKIFEKKHGTKSCSGLCSASFNVRTGPTDVDVLKGERSAMHTYGFWHSPVPIRLEQRKRQHDMLALTLCSPPQLDQIVPSDVRSRPYCCTPWRSYCLVRESTCNIGMPRRTP